MMREAGCALLAVGLITALGQAQTDTPGPQVLNFRSSVDGSEQPYAFYIPRGYTTARIYPLIVVLHGPGSNHRLALRRVFGKSNRMGESDGEASRFFPALPDEDVLAAAPLARGTMGYQGIAEQDVYDMLADVKQRFRVDEDRICLTGYSTGGGGALWLAATRPDMWAAVAAVSPVVLDDLQPFLGNLRGLPVYLFQGEIDPIVPVHSVRELQKELLDSGALVRYTEYPGVRHNAWDFAYKNAAIFTLLESARRNRFPREVHFASSRYVHARGYWVELTRLIPGLVASVDASFTAADRVSVSTKNLDGFTLHLAGHPVAAVNVDGKAFAVRLKTEVAFTRGPKGWAVQAAAPLAKHLGSEGPIREAVEGRQVYVYGTKDLPDAGELARRKEEAAAAAEWSTPDYRLQLAFAVLADRDVTDENIRGANLILFGTKQTNFLIDRLDVRLPLSLNSSAADYGLLYVTPVPGHLVLISSGVPWWSGPPKLGPGPFFVPEKYRLLQGLPDYVLFRGSLDDTVASGYFDNHWKLPQGAVERLRQTGAVQVK